MRILVAVLMLAAVVWAAAPLAAEEPVHREGWERGGVYDSLFNPNTVETISGKVIEIDRHHRPLPEMECGVAAIVQTADGRKVVCEVGPEWFTEYFKRQWNVQPGDEVTVKGSMVQVHGGPAMMVMWGRKGDMSMTVRSPKGAPIWDLDVADF